MLPLLLLSYYLLHVATTVYYVYQYTAIAFFLYSVCRSSLMLITISFMCCEISLTPCVVSKLKFLSTLWFLSIHFFQIGLINLENEDFVKKLVDKTQTKFQVSNSASEASILVLYLLYLHSLILH